MFVPAGPEPEPDPCVDDVNDEPHSIGILVMKEEAYIRLAYLQAVMGNVFGKIT